ncbi:MAG: hypothetical protein GQF41_4142 [Candidatus Rifleibacterium amylolyticum]|nr:MAG: hypothetical protein GQF41_4142 [Candidatus Rifleibacterium amylolyticum]
MAFFKFQSTRPRGARLNGGSKYVYLAVSIHAPAGGATPTTGIGANDNGFNPRARGGRDQNQRPNTGARLFQSTRPRGARLADGESGILHLVSIHAPAGGATHQKYEKQSECRFNPRARGGRDKFQRCQLHGFSFQSTRPRGARPKKQLLLLCQCVSIHAPAGGATLSLTHPSRVTRFNPRARGGRDLICPVCGNALTFQSTRPRGARPGFCADIIRLLVSIHAPAGGATRKPQPDSEGSSFNPRARGGRDLRHYGDRNQILFQSTRPRGARHPTIPKTHPLLVSIHAPAGGATG